MSRVCCHVIGCRRTIAAAKIHPGTEWLCADHWQLTKKTTRQVYFRLRRALRRWPDDTKLIIRANRVWSVLTRQAQEGAMGI